MSSFSRREFLKFGGLTLLGLSFGCAPEARQTPTHIPLEELIAHPDRYTDISYVQTAGYPEFISEQRTFIPVSLNWVTEVQDTYALHIARNIQSAALTLRMYENTFNNGVPMALSGIHTLPSTEYQVIGSLENDGTMYFLNVNSIIRFSPTVTPTK